MAHSLLLLTLLGAASPRAELATTMESKGVQAFNDKDFCRAAHLFEASDELLPSSSMLYNAGRAREAAGDLLAASDAYRAALSTISEPARRAELDTRILSLRARIEDPATKTTPCGPRPAELSLATLLAGIGAPPPDDDAPLSTDVTPADPAPSPAATSPAPVSPDPAPVAAETDPAPAAGEPHDEGGFWLGWPGVVGLGAGALLTVAGVSSWLVAFAIHSSVMSREQVEPAARIGQPFEVAGWVIGGTGLAVFTAGALLMTLLIWEE